LSNLGRDLDLTTFRKLSNLDSDLTTFRKLSNLGRGFQKVKPTFGKCQRPVRKS